MADFKVIVAGGRDFNDYRLLRDKLDTLLTNVAKKDTITIISGTAPGADRLGERYAQQRHYNLEKYPAKWHVFGNQAGFIRNTEMAKRADALVAFWNGESHGTRHMIEYARQKKLKVRVVRYESVQ